MRYCMHCMQSILETDLECPFCGEEIQVECSPHHVIPGTILKQRFLVGKVIGQGGFGITYVGRDLTLDVKIAIKEYYPNGYVSRSNTVSFNVNCNASEAEKTFFEKGKERFLKEAQILAKFRNEQGIVSVSDFFEENNTVYIVMEYLEGEDLKEYLKKYGTIGPKKTVQMMMPVMNTLEKIHAQGLIHRDISPDNIRFSENGLKLLDFGAARAISSVAKKSLSVMLKPGYAPYEQYYSDGEQGCWTDVYALCATMYKCITGITPPEAPGRTRNDNLKTPSALGIQIDPVIERSIMKGLSVWSEDRFQTITELSQGFQGKLVETEGNEETVYNPVGSGEGWEGKPVENGFSDESASMGQSAVGTEKAQNTVEKKDKEEGTAESLPIPKKKRRIVWIILLILVLLGIGTGIIVFASSRNQTEGKDKATSLSMTSTPVPARAETPVPTITNTPEPTATNTPEPTVTNTPVLTATSTPEPTATSTPVPTATSTPVPTTTSTPVPTATNTPVPTATNTPVPTATSTPVPTATNTPTPIPHVHDYSWKTSVTKQATCTSKGEEKSLCSCGEYLLVEIPAKEHSEVTVSGKAATCTAVGLTDGKKCSICGIVVVAQTEILASGHHYDNECDVSCNVCGETRVTYHKYDNDDDGTCNICNYVRFTLSEEVVISAISYQWLNGTEYENSEPYISSVYTETPLPSGAEWIESSKRTVYRYTKYYFYDNSKMQSGAWWYAKKYASNINKLSSSWSGLKVGCGKYNLELSEEMNAALTVKTNYGGFYWGEWVIIYGKYKIYN